jgi:hypothetical protein
MGVCASVEDDGVDVTQLTIGTKECVTIVPCPISSCSKIALRFDSDPIEDASSLFSYCFSMIMRPRRTVY